jgi:AAA15 family ATPase/GTPase
LNSNVLSSLAIFWNNASWKSNLLKAINFWRNYILGSTSVWPNVAISWVIPFKLDISTINQPSFFEFSFILDEKYYRYNFSLNNQSIISENLYAKSLKDKRERVLFSRKNQDIKLVNFDDRGIKKNVLENHLALTKFALENSKEALKINKFFNNMYVFLNGIQHNVDTFNLLRWEKKEEFKLFLLNLLKKTNSWIDDIVYVEREQDISNLPENVQKMIQQNVQFNNGINNNQKIIMEDCSFVHKLPWINNYSNFKIEEESYWTQKIFNLAGSLFNIISEWKILFIDELDSSLSTKILKHIVETFKNENNSNAQIVFTTNNTSLLDIKDIFRRDQIYLTDKEKGNFTDLFTLQNCKIRNDKWDYINIRKDLATIEKSYLEWKIKKYK